MNIKKFFHEYCIKKFFHGYYSKIIKDFIITLDDFSGFDKFNTPIYKKNNIKRIFIFFFPLILTAILVVFSFSLNIEASNGLLITFSLFILLLNFLFYYYLKNNDRSNDINNSQEFSIFHESIHTILSELRFNLFISVINLTFIIVYQWLFQVNYIRVILSGFIYYFTILFLTVLFTIFKHIFIFTYYYEDNFNQRKEIKEENGDDEKWKY